MPASTRRARPASHTAFIFVCAHVQEVRITFLDNKAGCTTANLRVELLVPGRPPAAHYLQINKLGASFTPPNLVARLVHDVPAAYRSVPKFVHGVNPLVLVADDFVVMLGYDAVRVMAGALRLTTTAYVDPVAQRVRFKGPIWSLRGRETAYNVGLVQHTFDVPGRVVHLFQHELATLQTMLLNALDPEVRGAAHLGAVSVRYESEMAAGEGFEEEEGGDEEEGGAEGSEGFGVPSAVEGLQRMPGWADHVLPILLDLKQHGGQEGKPWQLTRACRDSLVLMLGEEAVPEALREEGASGGSGPGGASAAPAGSSRGGAKKKARR